MYILQVWNEKGYLVRTQLFKNEWLASFEKAIIQYEKPNMKVTVCYQEILDI